MQMSEAYFKEVDEIKGPILNLLKKEGYQAVDMHNHTRYSVDGITSVISALKKSKDGALGLSITDHNHIEGFLKAKKLAGNDIFLIPGIEVTCHNGVHILLHFYSCSELVDFYASHIKPVIKANPWFIGLNHEELIDLASGYNCLISAPHPYGPSFCGIRKFKTSDNILGKIHAVEVINSCCIGKMNKKAIKWAEKINKGFLGGSDSHCLSDLGNSFTVCKAENLEEFLNQIKKRNSIVIGKEQNLLADAIHSLEKFVREEKKAPGKQLKKMWKNRGLLEWSYLKKKLKDSDFIHHFHVHHHPNVTKDKLLAHRYTEHLAYYLEKIKYHY